jgi:hypothetical protein
LPERKREIPRGACQNRRISTQNSPAVVVRVGQKTRANQKPVVLVGLVYYSGMLPGLWMSVDGKGRHTSGFSRVRGITSNRRGGSIVGEDRVTRRKKKGVLGEGKKTEAIVVGGFFFLN